MKRRTVLAAIGAASGGSALLTSTGAFTSVSADRDIAVGVAGDADAYLRLAACTSNGTEQPNAEYVVTSGGQMGIDLTSNNPTSGGGTGVNADARSRFDNVFEIVNQGTQDVCVDLAIDVPEIPPSADVPDRYDFEAGDPAVVFYRGDSPDEFVIVNQLDPGREGAIQLPIDSGSAECIGFEVRSFGRSEGDEIFDGAQLTIRAEAGADCEGSTADPVPTPPQDGLVSHWPLDSIEDGTAEDIVGGNNGTPSGGIPAVPGEVNQAAEFDGVDDYVNVPDDPSLDLTESLTLAAWVKPSSNQESYARIISREQSGVGNRQYNLGVDQSASDPRTVVDTTGTNTVEVSAMVPFTDDTWHHAAMTFDSTDAARLYVDGVEEDATTVSSPLVSRSSTVKFGAPAHLPGKDFFTGRIDDVRIYDRALTPQEVQYLYVATD